MALTKSTGRVRLSLYWYSVISTSALTLFCLSADNPLAYLCGR